MKSKILFTLLLFGLCRIAISQEMIPECTLIPLEVNVTTNANVCDQACTAYITATPTNGQPPYTYTWYGDPPLLVSDNVLGPVCAGEYRVLVRDFRGCPYRDTIIIEESIPIHVDQITVLNNTSPCGGPPNCNGVAFVDVSGGVPMYNYAFSTTPTTSGISNGILELCAGPYTVTVTDARNCSVTTAFEIGGGPMVVTVETQSTSCPQSCNGTANVVLSNGVGPYTYRWSNNPGSSTSSSSTVGLCQGNYIVTVTDNNNCTATAQFSINTASSLSVLINGGFMLPVCFDMCNASANALASGGSPPYTFDWLHMPGTNNGSTANSLCEGTYVLKVTDANGCSITTQYVLTERPPMFISATVTQPDCSGTLGTIAIGVVGGGAPAFLPYRYEWSNGAITSSVSGLVADAYNVTVTNAYDCTATATYQLTQPAIGDISLDLPDSVCVGSKLTVSVHGSGYVRLTIDGDPSDIDAIPANGEYIFYAGEVDPEAEGIHKICAIVYSANPDSTDVYCTDTVCDIINIKFCGCDSLVGKIDIESENIGGNTYRFTNNGMKATFLTWTINGDTIKSTGNNSITHTVGSGTYIVCVQAAFVFVDSNGHSTCCYDYACDTITEDLCAEWQTTDTVTYTLSPVNFHNATFTFVGSTDPITPTVIWNFGDGTDEEVNNGEATLHNYATAGTYEVCAYVIWSRGSWTPEEFSACCCVDTICITVQISPCNVNMYRILADNGASSQTILQLSPAPPTPIFTINWQDENGLLIGSGNSIYRAYTPVSDTEVICAEVVYMLPAAHAVDNGNNPECRVTICQPFTFGQGPQIQGMLRYFPNPTYNLITIEVKALAGESVEIEILDNMGRKIKNKVYDSVSEGISQYYITLDDLASGMYTMKVKVGYTIDNVKVIKQ